MNQNLFVTLAIGLVALGVQGCGSGREVEVTGEVKAAQIASVQGSIQLDFIEIAEDTAEEDKVISTVKLDKLGSFKQKVTVEGKSVRVFALNDTDKNGTCTAGEAFGQFDVPIKDDDTTDPIVVELAPGVCPTPKKDATK